MLGPLFCNMAKFYDWREIVKKVLHCYWNNDSLVELIFVRKCGTNLNSYTSHYVEFW